MPSLLAVVHSILRTFSESFIRIVRSSARLCGAPLWGAVNLDFFVSLEDRGSVALLALCDWSSVDCQICTFLARAESERKAESETERLGWSSQVPKSNPSPPPPCTLPTSLRATSPRLWDTSVHGDPLGSCSKDAVVEQSCTDAFLILNPPGNDGSKLSTSLLLSTYPC